MVLGMWRLYAKLACSPYFVFAVCLFIYSDAVLSIEGRLTVFFWPPPVRHRENGHNQSQRLFKAGSGSTSMWSACSIGVIRTQEWMAAL